MKDGPWFHKSGLNYKPISREGHILAIASFLPAIPLVFGFLYLSRSQAAVSWICGVAAVLLVFGFHAIAHYMSKENFGDE